MHLVGSRQSETFKVMERRLFKAIINPAIVTAWILGLYFAWEGDWFSSPWFHAKLTLAVIMSGLHGFYSRWLRAFAEDRKYPFRKIFPDHE